MSAVGTEEQLVVNGEGDGSGPHRPVSGAVAWLRKALVAVICAVLGHVPAHVLVALVVCLTAALLFASSKDARAEIPRLIPDGQFESAGALGVTVDNSAEASDPARGDVYAAGFLHLLLKSPTESEFVPGRVDKFDGSGNLLSPPSPFGKAFAYGGAAVDPVHGDVYALDALRNEIDTYDPTTGGPVAPSFPVAASHNLPNPFLGNPTVVGIAADSEGNIYVPVVPQNEVLEYSPTGVELKKFTGGSGAGALKGPTGVAIDSAGNLWVADTGNNRIEELSPTGAPVPGGAIRSEGVGSVAVDDHGDVFAIVSNSRDFCGAIEPPCSDLVEYGPAGAQVADLGAGVIGARQFGPEAGSGRLHEPVPDMVAVNDTTGEVYVSEAVVVVSPGESSGRVLKYRPPVAPTLEGESAAEVGASTAKLGAVLSPGVGGSYRFEYGTTASYGSSAPFPEGDTGAGFTARAVWAGVSGLEPRTTYHYRVVITSEVGGTIVGEDHTFTTRAVAGCPNEAFRTGFSANLPDCRAYELVTPPNKDSAQPDKNEGGKEGIELDLTLLDNRAAADAEGNGNGLVFHAEDVLPGSPSAGQEYVASRGPGGWSSQNVFPPTDYLGFKCPEFSPPTSSEDLSKTIIELESVGHPCGVDPELVSGEPQGSAVSNLFVRDNATGAYQLIDAPEEAVEEFVPATPVLLGESEDFSRIVFEENAKLTRGARPSAGNVYEWNAGHVRLATVLPDGTPVAGSFLGISADGSRVFFTAGGDLYARVNGSETVQLDASQAGGPGGGGAFSTASHDGSVVLFTDGDAARLTADTVPGSGTNLYRYDAAAPPGQQLTDLTPVAKAEAPAVGGMSRDGSVVFFTDDASAALTSNTQTGSGTNLYRYEAGTPAGGLTDLTPVSPAEVQGIIGISKDGSSVYFVAKGVLTAETNQHGEKAHEGSGNMYFSSGTSTTFTTSFIAIAGGHLQMSPNGRFLLFESNQALSDYDNVNPSGEAATELYLYDAVANSLSCASCNPSGERPVAFSIRGITYAGGPDSEGGAIEEAHNGRVAPRQLSDRGQVFFDSAEELLPADTNGKTGCPSKGGFPTCTDVYEFEPAGIGGCAEPAGCLSLLSTGTGSLPTFFIDASPNGNDVFIREWQKLVPRDTQDEAPSIYDVRVDGGLPEPGPPPPCATPEGCRGAPAAPQPTLFGAPASQTFSGAGNLLTPQPPPGITCKKGYIKKKGKCVKKPKPKRKAKKSTHASRKRGR